MLAIKATEEALESYNTMKLGKKVAYLIFIVEGSDIKVEKEVKKADAEEDYRDAFVKDVKASGQPRFAVVDWNHKLLFVGWSPDTSKGKNKMIYSTCKEGFVQELQGIQIKIQATDDGELSSEIIGKSTESKV